MNNFLILLYKNIFFKLNIAYYIYISFLRKYRDVYNLMYFICNLNKIKYIKIK